jgi:signal transduction histidine kinase
MSFFKRFRTDFLGGAHRFYFSFFIVVIVIVGSLISWYTYKNAQEETTQSLIARTNTIAQLVAEVDLSSLSYSEEDLENPTYQKLKKHFMNARVVNEDVRFIYIFVQDEGVVKFVVDSEPAESEDYSAPGEEYPEAAEQPEILDVFVTGKSIVQEAYTDRWGTWITGLSAIKDESGETKYVIGIDIDATNFLLKPYLEAAFPALLSLLLVVMAIAMYSIRKKELELVQTKAQFVSVASHELRAPLTGIRWSAENLLKQTDLSEDKRAVITSIHASSLHLLSTINDLLSISTAEHDFLDKKAFDVIDIKSLVESAIDDLHPTAESNEIQLMYEAAPGLMNVKGNSDRLKNLFSNLISNAIKYSHKKGRVTVSVGLHSTFKGKMVRIAVRDSGIGIPKQDIKKVSRGFYRSENAKIYTTHGTGLGLYICYKIAQLHGGSLDMDSIEGKGTMVIISLPFYEK